MDNTGGLGGEGVFAEFYGLKIYPFDVCLTGGKGLLMCILDYLQDRDTTGASTISREDGELILCESRYKTVVEGSVSDRSIRGDCRKKAEFVIG